MTWRRAHRAAAARFSASPSSAGGTAPARCPRTRVSLRGAREHRRHTATHTLGRGPLAARRGPLTLAGAGVIQVEPVSLLGALQLAFGGEEFAGRVVRLVVCATHLQTSESSAPPPRHSLERSPFADLHDRTRSRSPGTRPAPGTRTRACCPSPVCTSCHVCRESCRTDLQGGDDLSEMMVLDSPVERTRLSAAQRWQKHSRLTQEDRYLLVKAKALI